MDQLAKIAIGGSILLGVLVPLAILGVLALGGACYP